jgi:hypothetical protein
MIFSSFELLITAHTFMHAGYKKFNRGTSNSIVLRFELLCLLLMFIAPSIVLPITIAVVVLWIRVGGFGSAVNRRTAILTGRLQHETTGFHSSFPFFLPTQLISTITTDE